LRLRALAHAAIDVSDGVLADLGHLLTRSGVGALLDEQGLSCWAASWCEAPEILRRCVLSGGDDYELLFTAAPDRRDAITALGAELATPLCRCGVITAAPGVSLSGGAYSLRPGHDHFAA
jgi:thiamine-monophosphate kinase